MSKHTQPPWYLESERRHVDGSDLLIVDSEGGHDIADCRTTNSTDDVDEAAANARLIRLAPEMFDALRTILFEVIVKGPVYSNDECITKVKVLLAKAR